MRSAGKRVLSSSCITPTVDTHKRKEDVFSHLGAVSR